tara:strand:+ start:60 stop:1082 length:1023 start_codon:yes stop_codon:yes gene_type:complete
MVKALTLIKTLTKNGSDITVSIIRYSTNAAIVIENTCVTNNMIAMIPEWLMPTCSTNIGDALLKARDVVGKYTNRKSSTILVSDGYNTNGYSDSYIINEFSNSIDLSIGVGHMSDYNGELLNIIGKNFRGAPDEYIFRDSFSSFVFGSTTCVAKDISVTISSPFISPGGSDESGFNITDFHSNRHLPFVAKNDAIIVIKYRLVKNDDGSGKQTPFVTEQFEISSKNTPVNETSAMEIYLYCDIAQKVSNGANNKTEINKFIKIINSFLKEHSTMDKGSGIRGILIALRNSLIRATVEENTNTFKGLMRDVSSQTKTFRFDSIGREASDNICKSFAPNHFG